MQMMESLSTPTFQAEPEEDQPDFNPVYMQDRPVVIIAPPLHLHGSTS
jgi:hypothetical protein